MSRYTGDTLSPGAVGLIVNVHDSCRYQRPKRKAGQKLDKTVRLRVALPQAAATQECYWQTPYCTAGLPWGPWGSPSLPHFPTWPRLEAHSGRGNRARTGALRTQAAWGLVRPHLPLVVQSSSKNQGLALREKQTNKQTSLASISLTFISQESKPRIGPQESLNLQAKQERPTPDTGQISLGLCFSKAIMDYFPFSAKKKVWFPLVTALSVDSNPSDRQCVSQQPSQTSRASLGMPVSKVDFIHFQ